MFKQLSQLLSKISPECWRIGFTTVLVPSVSWVFVNFYADWKEQQKFITIQPATTKLLEGNWEGYGIQPVDDDSEPRLKTKEVNIQNPISKEEADQAEAGQPGYESDIEVIKKSNISEAQKAHIIQALKQGDRSDLVKIFKQINLCTNKKGRVLPPSKWTFFQAHLNGLKVNKRQLLGELLITPDFSDKVKHSSSAYQVTGRLEQNGDYIRLDYVNADKTRKDFGTILLEQTPENVLCGKFVSFGPISRSIVQGDYVFSRH